MGFNLYNIFLLKRLVSEVLENRKIWWVLRGFTDIGVVWDMGSKIGCLEISMELELVGREKFFE